MKIVLGFQSATSSESAGIEKSIPFFGNQFSQISEDVLLVSIVFVFILKGFLALMLHTLNVRIMQSETIRLVTYLSKSIFEFRNTKFRKLNSQDISYAIFNATEMVFRDSLIPAAVILADSILLILVGANLFLNAKVLFIPTIAYFVLVFLIMRRLEKRKTQNAYKTQVSKEISVRSLIDETNSSLRELYVSSKLNWMTNRIISLRAEAIKAGSVVALSQLRPKYIYEMSLFGGIGMIALLSKMTGNREFILTYLVLFVVSSSRMIPSLLRVQYYMGIFQKSKDQTGRIFEILGNNDSVSKNNVELPFVESKSAVKEFTPSVEADALSFSFESGKNYPTINNVSFKVLPGEIVAIVGSSGAGKSTMVDLILGYQKPSSGDVRISGLEPRKCFEIWPGKVSYVPQKVTIYEDTLLANVAIGLDEISNPIIREKVLNLLDKVELGDFARQQEYGLDTKLSEKGTSLSGGQIQRIGIARALFTDPSLLVLDESTSSLDLSTEHAVMDSIFKLAGEITLIIVAHRLSTIKSADKIFYMSKGEIEAEGDFEEVKKLIPDFEKQVNLLKS